MDDLFFAQITTDWKDGGKLAEEGGRKRVKQLGRLGPVPANTVYAIIKYTLHASIFDCNCASSVHHKHPQQS